MILRSIALCLTLGATAAQAGPWFLHPFGELRAYHGDWLAVCADRGAGTCRAVQYQRLTDDGFFGGGRMTLTLLDDGWALALYDDAMIDGATDLSITLDGAETLDLTATPGEPAFGNVAQTLWLPLGDDLVTAMRRANRVEVGFPGGSETYSLRGITAATNAIIAQARGERHDGTGHDH